MGWDNFDAAEDTGMASQFVEVPGVYMLRVVGVHPDATWKGEVRAECLGIEMVVVGAGVESEKDKGFNVNFFAQGPKDTEKGAGFKKRKLTALFIALDLISADNLGKGGLKVNVKDAVGRHVVMKLDKNDNGYMDICYADIWHVDDPKAAGKHINEAVLNTIPAALRHEAKYFEKLRKDPHAKPAAGSSAAAAAKDMFNDL
jgi:hypothetical protein